MRLEMLAKDRESKSGGCQSMYLAETGVFVAQGPEADDDTYGNVANLLPGEKVIVLKRQVVLDAVAALLAQ